MDQKIIDFIKGLMQPIITVMAMFIFFLYAMNGKFDADLVGKVVIGIILFWFGYTAIKNFTFTGNGKGNGTLPKANGGTVEPTDTGVPEYNPDEAVEIPEQIVTKFDKVNFEARVIALCNSVIAWANKSASSLFNAAMNIFWSLKFDNIQAHRDAIDEMISYAEDSFCEIWGIPGSVGNPIAYATEHLNDDFGCTTCKRPAGCTYPDLAFKARQMGEGYYTIYVRLVNLYEQRTKLA